MLKGVHKTGGAGCQGQIEEKNQTVTDFFLGMTSLISGILSSHFCDVGWSSIFSILLLYKIAVLCFMFISVPQPLPGKFPSQCHCQVDTRHYKRSFLRWYLKRFKKPTTVSIFICLCLLRGRLGDCSFLSLVFTG